MLYIDLIGFICCAFILHVVHLFDRFYMLYIDLTGFMCCTLILHVVH